MFDKQQLEEMREHGKLSPAMFKAWSCVLAAAEELEAKRIKEAADRAAAQAEAERLAEARRQAFCAGLVRSIQDLPAASDAQRSVYAALAECLLPYVSPYGYILLDKETDDFVASAEAVGLLPSRNAVAACWNQKRKAAQNASFGNRVVRDPPPERWLVFDLVPSDRAPGYLLQLPEEEKEVSKASKRRKE